MENFKEKIEIIRLLLENNCSIPSDIIEIALGYEEYKVDAPILKLLVEKAKPSSKDLYEAVRLKRSFEIIKVLLAGGAETTSEIYQLALRKGDQEVIQMIGEKLKP